MVQLRKMGLVLTNRAILLGAAAFALLPGLASAQPLSAPLNFDIRNMSFDLWCQGTQRYSAERCQARGAADQRAFQEYRAAIERFEIERLKQVRREEQIRERTGRDPTSTVANKRSGFP